jgi:hypothetical protein
MTKCMYCKKDIGDFSTEYRIEKKSKFIFIISYWGIVAIFDTKSCQDSWIEANLRENVQVRRKSSIGK